MIKFIFWFPRLFTIALIIFFSLFSLDVFRDGLTFGKTIIAVLIHLFPSFVLLILLLFSWKNGLIGAIGYFSLALFYLFILGNNVSGFTLLLIPFSLMIISLFFFWDWRINKL